MSDDLNARFEAAVAKVANAPADGSFKPSNDLKLEMYALYRQGKDGDVTGKKPGMLDVIGRAKYSAWEKLRGTPGDQAKQRYIDTVERIEQQHG